MEFKHYAGIDVSKNTLDVTVIGNSPNLPFHMKIPNNMTGFKQLSSELKKIEDFNYSTTLFCMEHTGILQ